MIGHELCMCAGKKRIKLLLFEGFLKFIITTLKFQ